MLEKLKNALATTFSNLGKWLTKVFNTPTKQIIAAVLAFVLVGALIGIASFGGGTSTTVASGDLQVQPVEVGQLTSSIGATGQVRAGQSATLNWQTTGIVEEIYVTEGQQVVDGEILAYLEQSSLPQSVISAQSDLLDAQDELDAFYDSFTGVSLASAQ